MASSTFPLQCFTIFLFLLLLTSGSSVAEKPLKEAIKKNRKLEDVDLFTTQFDTTVPIVNPSPGTNPNTPIVNPVTSPPPPPTTMTPVTNPTPSTTPPEASGGQWCIAIATASPTTLQVALDYACGYGGADCSPIQPGANCYDPNTVQDHASYAFNDYYHKNPAPTSCVFGGAAQLTSTDPSSGNCHYPSTTVSSTTPPANPTPTTASPPPPPTTTNPYTTPTTTTPEMTPPTTTTPDTTVYGSAEPTGLPSSAISLSCSPLLLAAATGFIWSVLAEKYV